MKTVTKKKNTSKKHWTYYTEIFIPCDEGLKNGRRYKTIKEFWDHCEKVEWLFWLWMVITYKDKFRIKDLSIDIDWCFASKCSPFCWSMRIHRLRESMLGMDNHFRCWGYIKECREKYRAPTLAELKDAHRRAVTAEGWDPWTR